MTDQEELIEAIAQEKRSKTRTYREISDESKAAAISADVAFKTRGFMDASQNRVNFHDLSDVRHRVDRYLTACSKAAAIPSFQGLATWGFGISRAALYKFMDKNQGSEVAEFLEAVRDTIADTLIGASLRRDADNSTAIFVLKNNHGFQDRIQVEPAPPQNPLFSEVDPEELRRRIEASVVIDD